MSDPSDSLIDQRSLQEVQCSGNDKLISCPVYGNDVVIKASNSSEENLCSNKVTFKQIANYEWEEKYYFGDLVSCNETYVAYIISAREENKSDSVRVINHKTSSRYLLKGFHKRVLDISFESLKSNKLACVDLAGTLHMYEILEIENIAKTEPLLVITRKTSVNIRECRIVWAPNILSSNDNDETMIGLSIGNTAETYNITEILKKFGPGQYVKEEMSSGVITNPNCHEQHITCLALSPDSKVLATGSASGEVKFWSLNMDDGESRPTCLHDWEPHDGEPVTSLFFCDNLLSNDDSSQFWRYLITGTENNSLLKIWCAVKWECIQTIRFVNSIGDGSLPMLKVSIDITSKYLLIANVKKPVLYICQLYEETEVGREKLTAISLSEFTLKDPLLSYSIFVAKERKCSGDSQDKQCKKNLMTGDHDIDDDDEGDGRENGFITDDDTKDDDDDEDNDDNDDDGDLEKGLNSDDEKTSKKKRISVVTLYAVQKKALQRLQVKFETNTSVVQSSSVPTITSVSQEDLLSLRDDMSDIEQGGREQNGEDFRTPSQGSSPFDVELISTNGDSSTTVSLATEGKVTPSRSLQDDIMVEKEEKSPQLIDIDAAPTATITSNLPNNILKFQEISPIETTLQQLEPATNSSHTSISTVSESLPNVSALDTDSLLGSENVNSSIIPTINAGSRLSTSITEGITELTPSNTGTSASGLNEIYSMLTAQQKELGDIKHLLNALLQRESGSNIGLPTTPQQRQIGDDEIREDMKVQVQLLQKSANSQFSKATKDFQKQCSGLLQQFKNDVEITLQGREQHIVQILSNIVNNTIAIKLEKTVKQEIKQTVIPQIDKMIARHLENIDKQIAQKLSVWERTLREETSEIIKSKKLSDSIGYSVASVLEQTICNVYQDTFRNIVLPGFENASSSMFMQINQSFLQGTKQYMAKIENYLDSKKINQQQSQDGVISNLQDLVVSFQSTADTLTSGVESNLEALMQKQLREATDRMQTTFGKTIESRIIPSISKAIAKSAEDTFKEWKDKIEKSLNIAAMQNSMSLDNVEGIKAKITSSLQNNDYNSAFEIALSASNLSIVLFTCQQVDVAVLFQKTSFPQPIVLSLIQQLSQNLLEDTDMKKKYLEESIMAVNMTEPIVKTHLPKILNNLNENLVNTIEHFQQNEPGNKHIKALRMLHLASKSLLHSN